MLRTKVRAPELLHQALISTTIKLSSPATREFWEIPVLFEDGDLLALDKPLNKPKRQGKDD